MFLSFDIPVIKPGLRRRVNRGLHRDEPAEKEEFVERKPGQAEGDH